MEDERIAGLLNRQAADILAARSDQPFTGIDDLWRRAGVSVSPPVMIVEAYRRRLA